MCWVQNERKDKIPFPARLIAALWEQDFEILLVEKNYSVKKEKTGERKISSFYYLIVFGGFTSIVSVAINGTVYPPESINVFGNIFLRSCQSDFLTAVW